MSTYYYLCCDRCQEAIGAASRIASGAVVQYGDADNVVALRAWFVEHEGHPLRVVDEYAPELDPSARSPYRDVTDYGGG